MISRTVVILIAFLLAAVGIGFWMAPEQTAVRFHVDAIGIAGLSTLRADFGGLFIGVALLGLAGALKRHRSMLSAAALVLAAVAAGRVLGLIANGRTDGAMTSLVIEMSAMAALLICARSVRASEGQKKRRAIRPTLVMALALTAAALAVAALLNSGVLQWMFERAARETTARSNTTLLADDALRVAICGSSAPLQSPRRAKACVAVFAGGKFYIVDVGPESVESLVTWGIPLAQVGGVLITHFHSDHIGDLGELNLQTWAQGRPAPLIVYGGPGVEEVVDGFNQAYRHDQDYRTTHHTARLMPPETWPLIARPVELAGPETPEKSRTGVVLDDGALRITAIEVDHSPVTPANAYRFDYKGRSVVITGDAKFHPPIAKAATGADVLVSEAIARPMVEAIEKGSAAAGRERVATIMHDIQDYHVSPQEAAGIANVAQVKLLVFYHLLPAPDGFVARRLFARGVREVRRGDWLMADDGSLYTLPIGSDEVRIGRVGG